MSYEELQKLINETAIFISYLFNMFLHLKFLCIYEMGLMLILIPTTYDNGGGIFWLN